MAKKEKKQKAQKQMKHKVKNKKTTKKRFFEVSVPLTSTKIQLYGASPEELNNKTIKLDLTKILRGKSLELKFRVKQEGQELVGIPESIDLAISYIRRVMRKGTDYCEDSFQIETKESIAVIKHLLVTRKRVSRTILGALREDTKKFLTTHTKMRSDQEIFSEIMANKLQKQLSIKLKKIYPLGLCEIRVFKILKPITKVSEEELN